MIEIEPASEVPEPSAPPPPQGKASLLAALEKLAPDLSFVASQLDLDEAALAGLVALTSHSALGALLGHEIVWLDSEQYVFFSRLVLVCLCLMQVWIMLTGFNTDCFDDEHVIKRFALACPPRPTALREVNPATRKWRNPSAVLQAVCRDRHFGL